MKRHNLKGITFNLSVGDARKLRAPMLTFYRNTEIATRRSDAIAVCLVAAEVYRLLDASGSRDFCGIDPTGPSIKFEMPDGLVPGGNAAFLANADMERILREAVQAVGIPEHDFTAVRGRSFYEEIGRKRGEVVRAAGKAATP